MQGKRRGNRRTTLTGVFEVGKKPGLVRIRDGARSWSQDPPIFIHCCAQLVTSEFQIPASPWAGGGRWSGGTGGGGQRGWAVGLETFTWVSSYKKKTSSLAKEKLFRASGISLWPKETLGMLPLLHTQYGLSWFVSLSVTKHFTCLLSSVSC